ncbi:type II toxin-antitoxin system RelE/ParE family toxin [Parabacteroides acidifaciens]|jgi:plasmid stabilization system protein ParE|uniref:Type II toxin-antitoxin system RelE/ParE family toxin n=1 Tax=Parabacteroides acidifaciens TaxID=2290935 RepID=A0A3D8H935_9BACT|nr:MULTISPECIES: type II toxin-antitoxin system RelE/ParE family toxin [Parabacteroides]MBC8603771.1 type II toxin-antitoxin system RelE/ParE family toxin [Parabacteroides acidifaciens]RDU47486.1 type II toxin-antitoxin system RelE/ParE family toxin [Parabacteroides acidifaciens]RHO70578.1 type II toxin-antitoxin system RelE/ParE family toxin [Parabacteroides sp. AF48-14]
MRIIIKWLPQAMALLDNIYDYYSEKSQTAAIRLYNNILDSAEPLRTFPNAGPVEPLLEEYKDGFRSIVAEKHYKLIYTVKEELVEIHAVWDCRQEGWRLKEMFK